MGAVAKERQPGEAYGCWVIVRPSSPDRHGRKRYMCRSTCCGENRVMRGDYLRRAAKRCMHCKGNGQQKAASW